MKLDVPYISQYKDVKDEAWQKRACGLVCLKMVLDFHEIKTLEINDFLKIVLEKEAYHENNGWIHDKLLEIVKSFGLDAYRKEMMEDESELKNFLKEGSPVIVSIKSRRFSFEFNGKFHQIVLVGYNKKGFYYNDSDYQDESGKELFVDIETFKKYWRKMAIFIHKIG